jgi:hypothetical protein
VCRDGFVSDPKREGTGQVAGHACGHSHVDPDNAGAATFAAALHEKPIIAGEIRVSVTSGEFIFNGEAGHGGQKGHKNALLIAGQVVAAAEKIRAEMYPPAFDFGMCSAAQM